MSGGVRHPQPKTESWRLDFVLVHPPFPLANVHAPTPPFYAVYPSFGPPSTFSHRRFTPRIHNRAPAARFAPRMHEHVCALSIHGQDRARTRAESDAAGMVG
jgi:hypothetical protein